MIEVLEKFLTKDKSSEFRNHFYSHPNYPSLLAVTDSLTLSGIENIAANVPFVHFSHLPELFMTELNIGNEPDYYLLKKDGENVLIEDKHNKIKSVDSDKLAESWTGNCLLVEEDNYGSVTSKNITKRYFTYSLFLILTAAVMLFYQFDIFQSLYLLSSVAGIVVSVEIIRTSFLANNGHSESKFCSFSKEFSCSSIINSNTGIISGYLGFTDLPIWFFSFSLLQLLVIHQASSLIGWFSVFSLPVVIYSLYVQKVLLKKWCLLCLLVSVLLIVNSLVFIMSSDKLSFQISDLRTSSILISLVGLGWFTYKKMSNKNIKNQNELNSLLRFKRQEDTFYSVSKKIDYKEELMGLPKIHFGNSGTKNRLVLFLSPSCPHCHIAYQDAMQMIQKYPENIDLEIAFNLNINNTENPFLIIAKTIMYLFNNGLKYEEAIDDWHVKKMKPEEWKDKWLSTDYNLVKEQGQLKEQYLWCTKNELNYAPAKIFNNQLVHANYDINELFYFFRE
ncbi:MAG: vitamin K epoxide reductase family protein [Flavobacterium sp.]